MKFENAYLFYDFARFYDWSYGEHVEDIPFYIHLAKTYESPILELACGTGRLSIPIAKQGFTITGMDISPEMLQIAKTKLEKEPEDVQNRIRLLQKDMSHFRLYEKFKMIVIPLASFYSLHTLEQKTNCLCSIFKHLTKNGIVVIDVRPAEMMANQEVGITRIVKQGINPVTGMRTQELNKKLSIDKKSKCVIVEHTYTESKSNGSEKSYIFTQKYTWVTKLEMQKLFQKTGFKNILIYGNYNKHPFTKTSPRMIFVARKGQ